MSLALIIKHFHKKIPLKTVYIVSKKAWVQLDPLIQINLNLKSRLVSEEETGKKFINLKVSS